MKHLIKAFIWCWFLTTFSAFAQEKTLKIISYNVLVGMKTDTSAEKSKFSKWFKQQKPDVVALQELTGFTQKKLESLARSYNHPYSILLIEGEKYPVGITSKYPITNVKKVTDNMDRGFIQADIKGQTFVVLHLSPFDYRTRGVEIDLVLANVKSQPHIKNWLLMGDFNSVSPVDSLAYQDGRFIEGLKKYEKRYPPIKKLVNGKIDYTVIQKVIDQEFTDALKLFHTNFVKSIHPKKFQTKGSADNASRIDFVFASKQLKKKIKKAEILVDDFTDNYSDHYPMMIELEIKDKK